jgi:thioredoxin 1
MQLHFPEVRFAWIDIEDQSELIDPLEVENFPTLLISAEGQPRFFGTVTPHAETLRKLIMHCMQPTDWRGAAEVVRLARKLTH